MTSRLVSNALSMSGDHPNSVMMGEIFSDGQISSKRGASPKILALSSGLD